MRRIGEAGLHRRQIRRQQDGCVREIGKWAALTSPGGTAGLVSISQHAVMGAVYSTAGGQQQLRLRQIERGRARNQQQHPAHQQIGDQPLHISSLACFHNYRVALRDSAITLTLRRWDAKQDCRQVCASCCAVAASS